MKRLLMLTLALAAVAPATASAWAPADSASIHPGVMTFTDGAQCTANFIYVDGGSTYIGQAAHCSGTGAATDTNGCDSQSLPIGTPVEVDGASKPGVLAYNSWITMQAVGEKDPETCDYNDLALVRLDPADVANVNPSVPGWGGPTGIASLGDTGLDGLHLRQLVAARRRQRPEPEAGDRGLAVAGRLEHRRLHRDARHPG